MMAGAGNLPHVGMVGFHATATIAGGSATHARNTDAYGLEDGAPGVSRFTCPLGVAVVADGTRYVTDSINGMVRRIDADGAVTTIAGTNEKGGRDGAGAIATFESPAGITVGSDAALYVTENRGGRVRRVAHVNDDVGWQVSTVVEGLVTPWGIVADGAGNLIVVETDAHRVVLVRETGCNSDDITVIAGDGLQGYRDGQGATAQFDCPAGVAIDPRNDDIIVTEWGGHRIRRIAAQDHVVDTVAGTGTSGHAEGPGSAAKFKKPSGVAIDGAGTVIVTEWDGDVVRRIEATADRTVSTLAGTGKRGFRDGVTPHFHRPEGCAIDLDGGLVVVDSNNHRIRKISGLGLVSPYAGASCVA
jgi:sugar lactone lactonase YvrE